MLLQPENAHEDSARNESSGEQNGADQRREEERDEPVKLIRMSRSITQT